ELAAGEEPCLASHRPRSNEVLEVVVVATDVAVIEEAPERLPPVQAVVDGSGDAAAIRHEGALRAQPLVELVTVPADLIRSDGAAEVLLDQQILPKWLLISDDLKPGSRVELLAP